MRYILPGNATLTNGDRACPMFDAHHDHVRPRTSKAPSDFDRRGERETELCLVLHAVDGVVAHHEEPPRA